jgi:hypothetical protein
MLILLDVSQINGVPLIHAKRVPQHSDATYQKNPMSENLSSLEMEGW